MASSEDNKVMLTPISKRYGNYLYLRMRYCCYYSNSSNTRIKLCTLKCLHIRYKHDIKVPNSTAMKALKKRNLKSKIYERSETTNLKFTNLRSVMFEHLKWIHVAILQRYRRAWKQALLSRFYVHWKGCVLPIIN